LEFAKLDVDLLVLAASAAPPYGNKASANAGSAHAKAKSSKLLKEDSYLRPTAASPAAAASLSAAPASGGGRSVEQIRDNAGYSNLYYTLLDTDLANAYVSLAGGCPSMSRCGVFAYDDAAASCWWDSHGARRLIAAAQGCREKEGSTAAMH